MIYIFFCARATNAENKQKFHKTPPSAYTTEHKPHVHSVGVSGKAVTLNATFADGQTNMTDNAKNTKISTAYDYSTLSSKSIYHSTQILNAVKV